MLLLAAFLPLALLAQPIVGPEIRSATFQTYEPVVQSPTPALGIVGDRSEFVICCALDSGGQSRIFVSRLSAEAKATSVTQLPVLDPGNEADAYHPAIASDGNGFLVAWLELARFNGFQGSWRPTSISLANRWIVRV